MATADEGTVRFCGKGVSVAPSIRAAVSGNAGMLPGEATARREEHSGNLLLSPPLDRG